MSSIQSEDMLTFLISLPFNYFFCRNSNSSNPPGFNLSAAQSHSEVAKDTDQSQLIMKKSWDVALGPIKGVIFHLLDV